MSLNSIWYIFPAINGWLPERLRNDLIWNRTVNLRGGIGNNLEADLVNEFLNREFKESISSVGARTTADTLERHGKIAGGFSTEVQETYTNLVESGVKQFSGKKERILPERGLKIAPTNKIGERQPLRRADNAGAGSSRLAGYGIAVPKHGAVVFGNSEHVYGSGSPGTGSVQNPIPTTAT
ncbi:uncharacterized protein LOC127839505 [Dreissena polymorpha]|uniref:uncharacterized protein LOC127839505 n=1 Tax=Dreissena polymorpha TaxID=45954 RepID=UPI0022643174|nr:uncharacterized protein LOC127839505 [Dreissena polymorpha]